MRAEVARRDQSAERLRPIRGKSIPTRRRYWSWVLPKARRKSRSSKLTPTMMQVVVIAANKRCPHVIGGVAQKAIRKPSMIGCRTTVSFPLNDSYTSRPSGHDFRVSATLTEPTL